MTTSYEIRRHNGQCGYGEWMEAQEYQADVANAVADEAIETGTTSGTIVVGGQTYLWREMED